MNLIFTKKIGTLLLAIYLIVIAVLLFRPSGLLGKPAT